MKLCYVTDRRALPGSPEEQIRSLLERVESAAHIGMDWIQIREKDLSARALAALAGEAVRRVPPSCRVLINDRMDVALAVGAGGVHLGENSMPVEEARRYLEERNSPRDFFVGVSTHSLESVRAAERSGADYVIFGPVYETPSKTAFGPPQGLERLSKACENVAIPVLAIGGITLQNAGACLAAGASGVAAIRLFQDADDVAGVVKALGKNG
jgi:thiamine-phosphate pyrophosphorylase